MGTRNQGFRTLERFLCQSTRPTPRTQGQAFLTLARTETWVPWLTVRDLVPPKLFIFPVYKLPSPRMERAYDPN